MALTHVWESDILPFPANVDYFVAQGMPQYGTPEYTEWFHENAPGAYMLFLLKHQGYTTYKFFRDLDLAFQDNMQAYFHANDMKAGPLLVMTSNYLHPKSGAVFFIVIALLLIICSYALFQKDLGIFPWVWVMTWAFLTATTTIFFTIFGDTYGTVRHALSSTLTYRLIMRLLLFILADISLTQAQKQCGKYTWLR